MAIDVRKLGCDFFVFSGHKLFGPTGIGVLYGKADLLESMPPYQGGGDMIKSVTFEKTIYNSLPYKFEAGTPNIAGVIGLGAAIDYVTSVGLDRLSTYEHELLNYGTESLSAISNLRLIGTARTRPVSSPSSSTAYTPTISGRSWMRKVSPFVRVTTVRSR